MPPAAHCHHRPTTVKRENHSRPTGVPVDSLQEPLFRSNYCARASCARWGPSLPALGVKEEASTKTHRYTSYFIYAKNKNSKIRPHDKTKQNTTNTNTKHQHHQQPTTTIMTTTCCKASSPHITEHVCYRYKNTPEEQQTKRRQPQLTSERHKRERHAGLPQPNHVSQRGIPPSTEK